VFASTAIFGVALGAGVPVAIFISGDLCSVPFGTARYLYSCFVVLRMIFVLKLRGLMAALCLLWWICVFGAGVLPGWVSVWICRSCWAARKAKRLLCLVFVCLLCLCAGQASSVEEVQGERV
jgi:hypothetical protein